MKKQNIILFLLLILIISSCFEDEDIIKLPPTESTVEIGQAAMTETYMYQVFFDLETNAVVKTNIFSDWDLGFSTSDTSWRIVLNNAKKMYAGNSFNTNFEEVTSMDNIEMFFDKSNGNPDSIATNGWIDLSNEIPVSNNYVYVIDRGYNENFLNDGYKKIIFQTPEDNKYKIKFADLDGQNEVTLSIEKDTSVNYVCLSFDDGIVDIEPPKNEWSLLFSMYQTLVPSIAGDYYPYLVNGALLNPYNVKAQRDTLLDFENITVNDITDIELESNLDIIGYDWKFFNFEAGIYTIVPGQNYIIYNNSGYYYKLSFVDFYNETSEKGYPTFRHARL